MKKPFLITLVILGISRLDASAQDTTYFNANWKITTPDSASYFRLKVKRENGWQVTDCFKSGKTQMAGFYSDDSCQIKQGEFTWYDDKGNLYHRSMYVEGNVEGNTILNGCGN